MVHKRHFNLAHDDICASLQAAEVQMRAVEDIEGRIAELQERHDAIIGENIQYIETTLSGASDYSFIAWPGCSNIVTSALSAVDRSS